MGARAPLHRMQPTPHEPDRGRRRRARAAGAGAASDLITRFPAGTAPEIEDVMQTQFGDLYRVRPGFFIESLVRRVCRIC